MEANFTFILGVSVAFFFFIGLLYVLAKKNVFSTNDKNHATTDKSDNSNLKNLNEYDQQKIDDLTVENNQLRSKLAFLEVKMEKMDDKIKELNTNNKELNERAEQLNKSKEKLEELQYQKDELLSMIVHDLKNPASTIKNFIELLESYDLNAVEQQEIMTGLLETSAHILALADEVSKIMSVEKTAFKLNLSMHNINEAIDIIVKRNLPNAQKKNINLKVSKDETIPDVSMDFNKIKEVIDNFINNAIKFAPEGIDVIIRTKNGGENIIVEVEDKGFGLSEIDVQKAFERGTRLSTKPTGGESSSGLGLWITKKIIEAHKGRVWVKSSKGAGSTFAFQIPV